MCFVIMLITVIQYHTYTTVEQKIKLWYNPVENGEKKGQIT